MVHRSDIVLLDSSSSGQTTVVPTSFLFLLLPTSFFPPGSKLLTTTQISSRRSIAIGSINKFAAYFQVKSAARQGEPLTSGLSSIGQISTLTGTCQKTEKNLAKKQIFSNQRRVIFALLLLALSHGAPFLRFLRCKDAAAPLLETSIKALVSGRHSDGFIKRSEKTILKSSF